LKGWPEHGLAVLVSVCLILPMSGVTMAAGTTQSQQAAAYANSSWAIGIVVPEGAGVLGGGGVRWGSVTNVTTLLSLPDIESPDRTVYAVMSVMTSDGSVLQAAAGALPNGTGWLTFAWLAQGAASLTPTYLWVLNATEPAMSPRANVSISIFLASGGWSLSVTDSNSGSTVTRQFPQGLASTLKAGDQEVFALESYSKTPGTFSGMGNLTLSAILLDGEVVVSGCYLYSDWDMVHNPLFVVGSSGSSPPSFIYAREGNLPGSYVWSYAGVWGVQNDSFSGPLDVLALGAVASAVALGGVVVWLARRKSDLKPVPGLAS
jgi:hypothetical protein